MKHNVTLEEALTNLTNRYGKRAADYIECIAIRKELTYDDYIQTDTLLSLQKTLTEYHDELTFLVYHQQTELWFRLALHEMKLGIEALLKDPADLELTRRSVSRANRILMYCADSFDLLIEGLDTDEFLEFRKAFGSSSGFQSAQFRAIEVLAGLERHSKDHPDETFYWERAARSIETGEPTLTLLMFKEKHLGWLNSLYENRKPYSLRLAFDILLKQRSFTYDHLFDGTADPSLVELASELADLDEAIINWKRLHLKAAAKHLAKAPHGTGETNWAEYLSKSIKEEHYFPEIISASRLAGDDSIEGVTLADA
jgi:tryptophan 2,3-dioxygenase